MNAITAVVKLNITRLTCCIFLAIGAIQAIGDVFSPQMLGLMKCYQNNDQDLNAEKWVPHYAWNEKGVYQDKAGDAVFEFVDLTEIKVSVDEDNIVVVISLAHIPYLLIFNQYSVPNNALEYDWAVYFDLEESSTDELSIAMSSYKNSNNEESMQSMLVGTQKDVWLISDADGQVVSANVDAQFVDRHTFSLTVNKSENALLKQIVTSTPVRFSTVYNFAGLKCQDRYPD